MDYHWLLAAMTALLVAGGLAESLLHKRRLARIPWRIHVNGTRGKSSVTRLIAAGLREGGIVTCAKTTGTLARMILPDGREYPIFRVAEPNVIEQVRIVATAAEYGAQALVIECMAIQPLLQWLSEVKLIRATHAVITNARADHLDVMGPTQRDVALALAGTVPHGGRIFTGEQTYQEIFRQAAAQRGSVLEDVSPDEVEAIGKADLEGFSYVEHPDNLALALKVCAALGVDRDTALRGMRKASPDPGAMTVHQLDFFGRRITFVNGFAANDPESTSLIWQMALDRFPGLTRRIILFNCRADRPDRSHQLGQACPGWPAADHYVLTGTGTSILAHTAVKAGLDMRKIVFAEKRSVSDIFEICVGLAGRSALVMGMANIGGQGLEIVHYFANRSLQTETL